MRASSPFSVGEAALLVLFAFFGLVLVGAVIRQGPLAVAATEILCFGLPAAFAASRRGGRSAVALVYPGARAVLGGALVGASAWGVLATVILPLQERLAPTPPALEEVLRRAVAPDPLALITVALLPAICEELLLRGVVTFALAKRFGAWVAVIGSALLFAVLHGSLYRVVPTFLLGCSFAAMALAARSIVPAIVAHALINGALWLLPAYPGLQALLEAHMLEVEVGAIVTLATGHILVFLRNSDVR